jgi:hypothetical protein
MRIQEGKYYFVSHLVLIVSLLVVLFVYASNGRDPENAVEAGQAKVDAPSLSVASSSITAGLYASK